MANKTVYDLAGAADLAARLYDNGDNSWSISTVFRQAPSRVDVTIGSATWYSGSVDMRTYGARGMAVKTPGAWTEANIGFQVSATGTDNWLYLRSASGSAIQISGVGTALAGVYAAPAEVWMAGAWPWVRVTSNGAGTAQINQDNDRALTLVFLQ